MKNLTGVRGAALLPNEVKYLFKKMDCTPYAKIQNKLNNPTIS